MLGSILAFLVIITYRLVFRDFSADAFYYALNLLFVLDILANFLTAVKSGHRRIDSLGAIARHYLRGWFAVDALAAFPFELVFLAIFGASPKDPAFENVVLFFQLLTLIKLVKARRIFAELQESLRIIPALRRLIMFAYWLSMALHVMALGWISIGASEDFRPRFDQYLRALYWVTTTISTIGYGDYVPDHDSNIQVAYTVFAQLFGVGMFSYVIANVSSLVSNLDVARSAYQHRLDEVNAYLHAQRIPSDLQERVRDYYSYLWAEQRGVSATSVLQDIPRNLGQEILLFLNRGMLDRVEMFRGADELFIRELVQLLRPLVFLPDEHVIRQGEFGDCMYFLTSGEVRVIVNGSEVARLASGSPFGETALVEDLHRNASVVSVSYSTGYRLDKADFDVLRDKYPEFDRRVRDVVEKRKQPK